MRRKILLFLLCAIMLCSITGCGSDMQRASALYPETAAAYRQACAAIGDLDTDA